jgi:hypothetical protein
MHRAKQLPPVDKTIIGRPYLFFGTLCILDRGRAEARHGYYRNFLMNFGAGKLNFQIPTP